MQLSPPCLAALSLLAPGVPPGEPTPAPDAGAPRADRAGIWTEALALGDVDGDGLPDLVVAGGSDGDRVLRGRADGGYDEVTVGSGLDAVEGARGVLLADLDVDGRLDLVRVGVGGELDLQRGVGGAVFEPWVTVLPAGPEALDRARRVAVVDADADRLPDLVVERRDGTPHVLVRRAGAGFEPITLPSSLERGATTGPGGGPDGAPEGIVLVEGLADAFSGACLFASSNPISGFLYPLSPYLNVDLAGQVGIGTTAQEARLHVADGDVVVQGELVTTQAGVRAVSAVGTPSTGAGGGLALLDGAGAPTVLGRADIASFGSFGSFELVDPASGDAARVQGVLAGLLPYGQLTLEEAGTWRARLKAYNPTAIVSTPQLELRNQLGKSTVQLSSSWFDGAALAWLGNVAGQPRAQLESNSGGSLRLLDSDSQQTISLLGDSGTGAPALRLATAEGDTTVEMQADFELSGAGSVTLGVGPVGDTVFLDGGSAGTGPELFANQQDGSRALSLGTSSPEGGGILALHTAEGFEVIGLTRASGGAISDGLLRLENPGVPFHTRAIELGETNSASVGTGHGFVAYGSTGKPVAELSQLGVYGYDGGVIFLVEGSGLQEVGWSAHDLAIWDSAAATTSLYWNGVTGAKNAVVATESYGARLLYVREGTEGWFEDAGVATARGGSARIDLDPLFLEVTTIDGDHPLRVFVTPHADRALVVDVGEEHFEVRTPDGTEEFEFTWLVQATRRGFEGLRLEPAGARDADAARKREGEQ